MDVVVLVEDVEVENEVVELEEELLDKATLLLVMAALHWALMMGWFVLASILISPKMVSKEMKRRKRRETVC